MLDRIRSNILKRLFLYWDKKRDPRPAPSRGDIEPNEMVEFLPNVFLIDVEQEPRRYRVRLMGTALVEWYGKDLTGRYLDEITDGVGSALDEIVANSEPWLVTGDYEKTSGRAMQYEILALPLSTDGATVDMILGGSARAPLNI